jgi:hypothetical protein
MTVRVDDKATRCTASATASDDRFESDQAGAKTGSHQHCHDSKRAANDASDVVIQNSMVGQCGSQIPPPTKDACAMMTQRASIGRHSCANSQICQGNELATLMDHWNMKRRPKTMSVVFFLFLGSRELISDWLSLGCSVC